MNAYAGLAILRCTDSSGGAFFVLEHWEETTATLRVIEFHSYDTARALFDAYYDDQAAITPLLARLSSMTNHEGQGAWQLKCEVPGFVTYGKDG